MYTCYFAYDSFVHVIFVPNNQLQNETQLSCISFSPFLVVAIYVTTVILLEVQLNWIFSLLPQLNVVYLVRLSLL